MSVSVCLPTYNASAVIRETLKSLITQSMQDYEIVITDNSEDRATEEVVTSLNSEKIKYIRNEKNLGYVGNVNKSVQLARADVVAIYHSDDIYERDIIEKEHGLLQKYQDVAAVFSMMKSFKNNDIKDSTSYDHIAVQLMEDFPDCYDQKNNAFIFDKKSFYLVVLEIGNIFPCPSLMMKKEIYQELEGFSDRIPLAEDLDFWFRIVNRGYKIAIYNEKLFHYRLSSTQGYEKIRTSRDVSPFFKVVDSYDNDFKGIRNGALEKKYQAHKAASYLKAAKNCLFTDHKKCRVNLKDSRKTHRFKAFSRRGIFQNFGGLLANGLGNWFLRIFKPKDPMIR